MRRVLGDITVSRDARSVCRPADISPGKSLNVSPSKEKAR